MEGEIWWFPATLVSLAFKRCLAGLVLEFNPLQVKLSALDLRTARKFG